MNTLRIFVIFFALNLPCGCTQTIPLNFNEPSHSFEKDFRKKLGAIVHKKYSVSCIIDLGAPRHGIGQVGSPLMPAELSKNYSYPLKSILDQAFQSAIYEILQPPRAEVMNAFTLEVDVDQSLMMIRGQTAEYNLKCHVVLKNPMGKILPACTEDLARFETSPFDGKNTPQAVWKAAYELALEYAKSLSQNPQFHKAANDFIRPQEPKKTFKPSDRVAIECDLRLYDLKGNLCASAGATAEKEIELRFIANRLAKELVDDLKPQNQPKIAVLDLRNTNKEAEAGSLGRVFAEFVQTALGDDKRVRIATRKQLEEILEEHKFRITDLSESELEKGNIKITKIDYLLMGSIAVLRSKTDVPN